MDTPFDAEDLVWRYRFAYNTKDASECLRLRNAWKESEGEDSLHEMAWGEPIEPEVMAERKQLLIGKLGSGRRFPNDSLRLAREFMADSGTIHPESRLAREEQWPPTGAKDSRAVPSISLASRRRSCRNSSDRKRLAFNGNDEFDGGLDAPPASLKCHRARRDQCTLLIRSAGC